MTKSDFEDLFDKAHINGELLKEIYPEIER